MYNTKNFSYLYTLLIINYVQYKELLLFVHTFNNKFIKNIIKLLLLPYLF